MEAVSASRVTDRLDARQVLLIAALLVLAAVGWVVTGERMAGMDDGAGTDPGSLGFYVTAWVVMLAAMMFPSIVPMITVYQRVQRSRRERGRASSGATALFIGGYMVERDDLRHRTGEHRGADRAYERSRQAGPGAEHPWRGAGAEQRADHLRSSKMNPARIFVSSSQMLPSNCPRPATFRPSSLTSP